MAEIESGSIEVRASARNIGMSPFKVRLVANLVRGMQVDDALNQLKFMTKAAAKPVAKVIKSATANAEENFALNRKDLYIARIFADGGPMVRRGRPGARGRFKPLIKRSAHLTVVLNERSVN